MEEISDGIRFSVLSRETLANERQGDADAVLDGHMLVCVEKMRRVVCVTHDIAQRIRMGRVSDCLGKLPGLKSEIGELGAGETFGQHVFAGETLLLGDIAETCHMSGGRVLIRAARFGKQFFHGNVGYAAQSCGSAPEHTT